MAQLVAQLVALVMCCSWCPGLIRSAAGGAAGAAGAGGDVLQLMPGINPKCSMRGCTRCAHGASWINWPHCALCAYFTIGTIGTSRDPENF